MHIKFCVVKADFGLARKIEMPPKPMTVMVSVIHFVFTFSSCSKNLFYSCYYLSFILYVTCTIISMKLGENVL